MEKEEFELWYERVKEEVDEYKSPTYRTAVIAGLFGRSSKKSFTGGQVSEILALRYPEKE